MGNGHRGVAVQHQHGHRLAHDVAASQHDHPLALELDPGGLHQRHAAQRGGGDKEGGTLGAQPTGVDGVDPVHVLGGGDAQDQHVQIHLGGDRLQHHDAVDRGVVVEGVDRCRGLGLGGVRAQFHAPEGHADAGAIFLDGPGITSRSAIIADEDDGQGGGHAVGRGKGGHFCFNPVFDLFGKVLAI